MPRPTDVGVGVSIVVVDEFRHPGEVLMGIRKGAHGAGTWAPPGGWIDRTDETFEDTVIRELYEETGIRLLPSEIEAGVYATTENHPDFRSVTLYIKVHVNMILDSIRGQEPDKCESWHWIDKRDLGDMAEDKLFGKCREGIYRTMGWYL